MSVPATSLAAYHSLGSIPSSLGDEICNLLELAGPNSQTSTTWTQSTGKSSTTRSAVVIDGVTYRKDQ